MGGKKSRDEKGKALMTRCEPHCERVRFSWCVSGNVGHFFLPMSTSFSYCFKHPLNRLNLCAVMIVAKIIE